jgi:hypothetical protein
MKEGWANDRMRHLLEIRKPRKVSSWIPSVCKYFQAVGSTTAEKKGTKIMGE